MTSIEITQPLCRYCGKKIRKRTTAAWFGNAHFGLQHDDAARCKQKPRSIDEVRRLVNQAVVAVSWHTPTELVHGEHVPTGEPRYIERASLWDGQSYVDNFFCNGDHAKRFAYLMARSNCKTEAYLKAYARQRAEGKQ